MKEVMRYESFDGTLHNSPESALMTDFNLLKDALDHKVRFLSVLKEEGQFWEVKQALKSLYEKWQEYREIREKKTKKHGEVTVGTITTQRPERMGKTPELKAA